MTEDLKPCPFCGGKAILGIDENDRKRPYFVYCDKCNNSTAFYKSKRKAVEAWNRRVES